MLYLFLVQQMLEAKDLCKRMLTLITPECTIYFVLLVFFFKSTDSCEAAGLI